MKFKNFYRFSRVICPMTYFLFSYLQTVFNEIIPVNGATSSFSEECTYCSFYLKFCRLFFFVDGITIQWLYLGAFGSSSRQQ